MSLDINIMYYGPSLFVLLNFPPQIIPIWRQCELVRWAKSYCQRWYTCENHVNFLKINVGIPQKNNMALRNLCLNLSEDYN